MRRILSLLLVISILTLNVFAGTYEPETYIETKQETEPKVITIRITDTEQNSIYFVLGWIFGTVMLGSLVLYFDYVKPKIENEAKLKENRKRKILVE